jgi:endonuclease/exonuclease/phosphatase family metal-dependent hydrolase
MNDRPSVRWFLLALALAVVPVLPVSALTVVAWNLEWFPGRSPQATPEAEAQQMAACREALQKLDPDIFIVEEVKNWQAFEDLVAAVPGLRVNVVSAFRDGSSGEITRQQVGIASKLKVVSAWSEIWKPAFTNVPRGFSFAALEDPASGELLMVYGLHLKSNRVKREQEVELGDRLNADMRNESVRQLLQHMKDMEITFAKRTVRGWLAGGDINTNHDEQFGDRVVELMVDAGFWNSWDGVPREQRLTWHGNGFHEPTTFDYLFTKGLGSPRARLLPQSEETSDHGPVVLKLE